MVATLQWQNSTAASASWSTITTLRYKNANNNTDDANDPLVRPASGTEYSFEKALRINISVAPTTNVTNLRVLHSRNPIATGVSIYYGFTDTYAQPASGASVSSTATTELTNSEVTWTGASAKTDTGQWGQFLYLQARVTSSASGGEVASWETIARYDEI